MMHVDLPGLPQASSRHYAGILVLTPPADLAACIAHLEGLTGVEVHHRDAKTGKIIVVLESSNLEGQEHLLQRVRRSPHVLLAELVYYRRDEAPQAVTPRTDEKESIGRTEA